MARPPLGKAASRESLRGDSGFAYVNSGAIYRAITWHILQHRIDPGDTRASRKLLESVRSLADLENNESRIFDRQRRSDGLLARRSRERKCFPRQQRSRESAKLSFGKCAITRAVTTLVVEGRDIGSVVFPDTPYKFYIDASPDVRLSAALAQGQRDEIAARDRADSSRACFAARSSRDDALCHRYVASHDRSRSSAKIIEQLKLKGLAL